jgi:chemotaxis protein histidine kinase CheA
MAENAVELEIRVDGLEAAVKSIQDLGDKAKETAKSTAEIEKSIKAQAMTAALGQVAERFDGVAREALKFTSQFAQAVTQGGPLVGGLVAVGAAADLVDAALKEQERDWQAIRKAAADAAQKEQDVLKQVAEETKHVTQEARVLALVRSEGMEEGKARALVELQSIASDRETGQKKLADIKAQLAEEERLRNDAIGRRFAAEKEIQEKAQYEVNATNAIRLGDIRTAAIKEADIHGQRAEELRRQQEIVEQGMIGSAQRVANAEKTVDLEIAKSGDAAALKDRDDKKQRLSDAAAFYAKLAEIQDAQRKAEREEAAKHAQGLADSDFERYQEEGDREKKVRDKALADEKDAEEFRIKLATDRYEKQKKLDDDEQTRKAKAAEEDRQRQAELDGAFAKGMQEIAQNAFNQVGSAIGGAVEKLALYHEVQGAVIEQQDGYRESALTTAAAVTQGIVANIAKEATVKAAFEGASALASLAFGDVPAAISHGLAAGQFATVAGLAGVTAAGLGAARGDTAAEHASVGKSAGSGSTAPSSSFGGSGGSSRSGGQAPVTVIFQSPVLASRSEVASDLDALLKQAERRR